MLTIQESAVLNEVDEQQALRDLVALRRACWVLVLTEPALAGPFLHQARETLGEDLPRQLEEWEGGAAPDNLVHELLEADPEGRLLDILAERLGDEARRLKALRAEYERRRDCLRFAHRRLVHSVVARYEHFHLSRLSSSRAAPRP